MQDYKAYIEELLTLKIELKEYYVTSNGYWTDITPAKAPGLDIPKRKFLWLGHYDQKKSNYETELIKLQQRAYSDILVMGKEAATLLHQHLVQRKGAFSNLYKKMRGVRQKFREGQLSHTDLELVVYPYFTVSIEDSKKQGIITQEFMNDLEDALMHKTSNLGGLIKQLADVLGTEQNTTKQLRKSQSSSNNIISFEEYLTDKRLYPLLQKHYTNAKPEKIVYMVLALEEGVWIKSGYKSNVSALHRALKYSFKEIGRRQTYTAAFNKFNQEPTVAEELNIKFEQKVISAMLDKLKEKETNEGAC